MATRNNLIEQIKMLVRVASTVFAFGGFLQSNGAGKVLPLTPGDAVVGLGLQEVTASDPNYAVAQDMPVDGINKTIDRFLVQITGTATALMEGRVFDISAGSASIISVTPIALSYGTLTGTFTAGEMITQTTGAGAGSTAVVITDNGATAMTFQSLSPVGSGFIAGATIVGASSGATAVIGSTPATPTQFKLENFISATLGEFSVLKTS